MLPLMMDIATVPVAVIGQGSKALMRLEQVEAAGAHDNIKVFAKEADDALAAAAGERLIRDWPGAARMGEFRIAFIAGIDESLAREFATLARRHRVLVNVEDLRPFCDFFMPSLIRRGDLLIAVSTAGKSPALGQRIREATSGRFGVEWAARLDEMARLREAWRRDGHDPASVRRLSEKHITEQEWLT